MRNSLSYAALAACLAMAAPALAQSPAAPASKSKAPSTMPNPPIDSPPSTAATSAAPATAPAATGADAAANASAAATLTTGMSVKDNTGALIGEVKALKDGVATIQMGSDTFTVDANKLGVQGGAATINATQAELKGMLPKK
jgi:glucose/arabinose dehydrogenase